jgi:flagellar motor switch protein FliM
MEIKNIFLNVTVLLGKADMPTDLFQQLEPGDIVILNQDVHVPLQIKVEMEKRFLGYPGLNGIKKAIKIEKKYE